MSLGVEQICVSIADDLHYYVALDGGLAEGVDAYSLRIEVEALLPILVFPCLVAQGDVLLFGHRGMKSVSLVYVLVFTAQR